MAKTPKVKTYDIKVPVYTTEPNSKPIDLFGGVTYENMLDFLRGKINDYNKLKTKLSFDNKSKTKKTVISNIQIHENKTHGKNLLLQVTAYTTNLFDGYLESSEKIKFKNSDKLGSETNFILLHPMIIGLDPASNVHYFLVLIYEDPTKTNEEITKITKQILSSIINQSIANIKLPAILEELKSAKFIPELHLKYSGLYYDSNEVDVELKEYLVSNKASKSKVFNFKNFPLEKLEDLFNIKKEEDYQKKEIRLLIANNEYKIISELLNEAKDELKETTEKIFNMKTNISESELKSNVHEIDFVFSKLTHVLDKYLNNDKDE